MLVPLGAASGTTDEVAELVGHGPIEPDLLAQLLLAAQLRTVAPPDQAARLDQDPRRGFGGALDQSHGLSPAQHVPPAPAVRPPPPSPGPHPFDEVSPQRARRGALGPRPAADALGPFDLPREADPIDADVLGDHLRGDDTRWTVDLQDPDAWSTPPSSPDGRRHRQDEDLGRDHQIPLPGSRVQERLSRGDRRRHHLCVSSRTS